MAKKTVGELIREARAGAGLTQEELARAVPGVSASDIGRAERGEKELAQSALREIARATGVTQKSLLEAARTKAGAAPTDTDPTAALTRILSGGSSAPKKTAAAKKKTAAAAGKATAPAAKKTAPAKKASETLSAAEKRFLTLYRAADADARKAAEAVLRGEKVEDGSVLAKLLDGASDVLAMLGLK